VVGRAVPERKSFVAKPCTRVTQAPRLSVSTSERGSDSVALRCSRGSFRKPKVQRPRHPRIGSGWHRCAGALAVHVGGDSWPSAGPGSPRSPRNRKAARRNGHEDDPVADAMIEDEVWEWHDAAIARRRSEYLSEIRAMQGYRPPREKPTRRQTGPVENHHHHHPGTGTPVSIERVHRDHRYRYCSQRPRG
jgi:hypothetical protein